MLLSMENKQGAVPAKERNMITLKISHTSSERERQMRRREGQDGRGARWEMGGVERRGEEEWD